MKKGLKIQKLTKEIDGLSLFKDFELEFEENSITCILGPSGCGKTTLLNILGGLKSYEKGSLLGFDNKTFSYIFQEPRLLPWKTVKGNIDFVLSRDLSADERNKLCDRLIKLIELEDFASYYPAQLSGGMRQRVSIARAFACPSDIILMDEALSGLDVTLKLNMIRWFLEIWKKDRRTVVFVTHDVEEALLLGDEIVVFSQAPVSIQALEQIKTPQGKRSIDDPGFTKLKKELLKVMSQ